MTSEAMRTQFNVQSAILSILTFSLAIALTVKSEAQPLPNGKHVDSQGDRFYQIDQWLPTPNDQRTASGAPGPEYWQQRADYKISIALDDIKQFYRDIGIHLHEDRLTNARCVEVEAHVASHADMEVLGPNLQPVGSDGREGEVTVGPCDGRA